MWGCEIRLRFIHSYWLLRSQPECNSCLAEKQDISHPFVNHYCVPFKIIVMYLMGRKGKTHLNGLPRLREHANKHLNIKGTIWVILIWVPPFPLLYGRLMLGAILLMRYVLVWALQDIRPIMAEIHNRHSPDFSDDSLRNDSDMMQRTTHQEKKAWGRGSIFENLFCK